MRRLSHLLEFCGWALVVFTVFWTVTSTATVTNGNPEPDLWDRLQLFAGTLGYLLEGVILGLIAILVARLARHPDAEPLGQQAADMIKSARTVTGKDDD